MATKEVPSTVLPSSWVQVGGHNYNLHVLLLLDGQHEGQYMGMAIGEVNNQVITTDPPSYRIFDCWRSLVGKVLATHVPQAKPADDVKVSMTFAATNGVKSPLR